MMGKDLLHLYVQMGREACIFRLGEDFVRKHADSSSFAYSETEDGVWCFLGVDDCPGNKELSDQLILDSKSRFPYRCSCTVSTRGVDYIECIAPSNKKIYLV